jgi:hypothetical protein
MLPDTATLLLPSHSSLFDALWKVSDLQTHVVVSATNAPFAALSKITSSVAAGAPALSTPADDVADQLFADDQFNALFFAYLVAMD